MGSELVFEKRRMRKGGFRRDFIDFGGPFTTMFVLCEMQGYVMSTRQLSQVGVNPYCGGIARRHH